MAPVQWGNVDIVEIPPYTYEEAKAVWYDEDELEKICSTVWETVGKISTDQVPPIKHHQHDEDEPCVRGLEEFSVRGSLERLVAKCRMDVAVLEEQHAQRAKGISDAEAIARVSRLESQRHVDKAVAYAKMDQESADKYLNRTPKTSTTKPPLVEKHAWFRRGSLQGKTVVGRLGVSLRNILRIKR